MPDQVSGGSAPRRLLVASLSSLSSSLRDRHAALLRSSSLVVGGLLSLLMVSAVAPPIIADQSDRAVVNAPVTLLTAPIDGELNLLSVTPGHDIQTGASLAHISNAKLDRSTLIALQDKAADARENFEAARAKKESDRTYVRALDTEISQQTDQFKTQLQSQITEAKARLAESDAVSNEKKTIVDRQNSMVARGVASPAMVAPTSQQYAAANYKVDADKAKLVQKTDQLDALERGVYVGEDLTPLGTLVQKRRDIELDAARMAIEEKQYAAVLADRQALIDTEQHRLAMLANADVRAPGQGKVLTVGAAPGRRVSAGDTIASVVNCERKFVVAIFSYRQGQTMTVGTRVRVDGAPFGAGVISAVLPKTSDKVDERFAVPFPQTERRELYAIVSPADDHTATVQPAAAMHDRSAQPACPVGQWVTVTRDNGFVPSMSVTWRRLENLIAGLTGGDTGTVVASPAPVPDDAIRQSGLAQLAAAMYAAPGPIPLVADDDWRQRPQAVSWR